MFWSRKKQADAPPPQAPKATHAAAPIAPAGDGRANAPTTAQFLTGDSAMDRRSVEVLLEAIARVSESRDLEALLVDIVDRSIEITGAERGLLVLADPNYVPGSAEAGAGEVGLVLRVARARGGQDITDDVRFSTTVARRVLDQGQPVRSTVQSDSDALELGRSVFDLKLRAVMCVPLRAPTSSKDRGGDGRREEQPGENAARGVLYVDSRAATREFTARDLGLFAALSQHISIALENARLFVHSLEKTRLEHSLELASAIQSGLMPPIPKDVHGYEVHGWFRPAERTSGDFYDFVKTRDKRLAVVVGDVTGHGMGPALITATAQGSLRAFLRVAPDAATAVNLLNQDLSERMDPGMFVTLLLVICDERGGLELINAGHHAPLCWRKATGAIEELTGHGAALGMMPEAQYTVERSASMGTGDVLLAFTDGLIEAPMAGDRDQLFGEDRTRKLLSELCSRGAQTEEIARKLAEEALSFSGGAHEDDITLVVVRKT